MSSPVEGAGWKILKATNLIIWLERGKKSCCSKSEYPFLAIKTLMETVKALLK